MQLTLSGSAVAQLVKFQVSEIPGSNPGSGKFFADLFYLSKRDRVQNSPTVGVTCRFFVYDQSKTVSFIINASQDESQTQWVEGDGNMQFVGNSLTD